MASLVQRARRLIIAVRASPARRALRYGVLPIVEPQQMLRRLRPAFVVDVGANRGQFALDVVISVPDATVLSFEPLASEAAVFRKVLGNQSKVELRECALGRRRERRVLHISHAADSSSLLALGPLQSSLYPGTSERGTIEVDVEALSEALTHIVIPPRSLLKADVQGYELEVLRGASKRLLEFSWVYVELSFVELYRGQPLAHEVIAYLLKHGFIPADTSKPSTVNGRTVQIDILFENSSMQSANGVDANAYNQNGPREES